MNMFLSFYVAIIALLSCMIAHRHIACSCQAHDKTATMHANPFTQKDVIP